MTATRKTAAQKAAEAAEREEYTGTSENHALAPDDTETVAAPDPRPAKGETVQQLKNRLRNEAEREVLNTHKDEVIKITQAKYDDHGLEYVRRLTEEEKAAKTIEELYRKHPNLRPETTVLPDPTPREDVPVSPVQTFDHSAEASVGE